jgi:CheY-like chemotaxis protein
MDMKGPKVERKSILVIEDEPAIRDICRRVLTGTGFEVDFASNGKEGKEIADRKQYSLYLIDIRTPEMNGIEFYEWFKETYPQLENRTIFTTGSIIGGEAVTFIEKTGRPMLGKPFTPDELKTIVQKTLEEV